jgi:N-acetylmuramoyl-L-alanine amidase
MATRTATPGLPLRPGSAGPAVRDLHHRLAVVGHSCAPDAPGSYGPATEQAVRDFQQHRGVRVDGICGPQTWSELVEAGWQLGDRYLYLAAPMLRGDDVAELQRRLGGLGFDAGRVDGICGPATVAALTEFQRNAGLPTDGICGPDTLAALRRVSRADRVATIAGVRAAENLRAAPPHLAGRRVAVAESGGVAALVDALGRTLGDQGAVVTVLHHPDDSTKADEANAFGAAVFVAVAVFEDPEVRAAYYGREGFVSVGGRRLAELTAEAAARALPGSRRWSTRAMRLPLLRETRMPAVMAELGPPEAVVERTHAIVDALAQAVARWAREPV